MLEISHCGQVAYSATWPSQQRKLFNVWQYENTAAVPNRWCLEYVFRRHAKLTLSTVIFLMKVMGRKMVCLMEGLSSSEGRRVECNLDIPLLFFRYFDSWTFPWFSTRTCLTISRSSWLKILYYPSSGNLSVSSGFVGLMLSFYRPWSVLLIKSLVRNTSSKINIEINHKRNAPIPCSSSI